MLKEVAEEYYLLIFAKHLRCVRCIVVNVDLNCVDARGSDKVKMWAGFVGGESSVLCRSL